MNWRKIIPWAAAVALLIFFQFLTIKPGMVRLPFPKLQQVSQPALCGGIDSGGPLMDDPFGGGCGCTAVNYTDTGFPFRNNLYDYCGQDPTIIWWVQAINWALQLLLAAGLFFGVKKLLRR